MFLKYSLILFISFISLTGFSQSAKSLKDIRVNQDRLEKRILELTQFGKGPDGKSYRVAFSKADQEGRAYYMGLMKSAGLEVSVDYAGNIIGKRKGKDPSKKPIAFGSHIDMVPDGGNYDGCVGSMGALEVMEALNENKIITERPLELIIFSNEEGGVIGSMAIAGQLKKEGLDVVTNSGLTNSDGIKAIGGNPDNIHLVARKQGDIKAYLELHIEQGGILDEEKIQIGVVEGIVGIDEWEITVEGFANHAGTTPMDKRQDALLAASKLVIAVNEVINSYEGRQVGTVGKIAASPGAYNVIPGKVMLGLEIRDLSSEKILKLFRNIEKRAAEIAQSTHTKISFRNLNVPAKPALMTNAIQDKITESANMLGYSYKRMQSGAGHDAQEMAQIAPAGMIFVPSMGGISHSPKEFTKAVDMANGANVLLHTVLALDKE
jgi:N-carbamoyl-L-amino-acid hydrolase